jgi:hypothetical protein
VRNVTPDQVAQITKAMRRITPAAITSYVHRYDDPTGTVLLSTADGKDYMATQIRGRWKVEKMVLVY